MSFSIGYSDDYVYAYNSIAEIGKRIVIIGCNTKFDEDGDAIINITNPDTSTYDYRPMKVSSASELVNLFGKDNDLLYAYKALGYSNVTIAAVMNVPYKPLQTRDKTLPSIKDREQFKENIAEAIQSLFDRADFDICVITSINVQDDYETITNAFEDITFDNTTRLMLIKAKKPELDETVESWNTTLKDSIDIIASSPYINLSNICIIADNAYYDSSLQSTYTGTIDYNNLDMAAYIAGLTVASKLKHPSITKTVFNAIKCPVTDERVSCFRKNSMRGVIVSNFSTLQRGNNSKIALYSAINIYRVSVILGELTQQLKPLVGQPMSIHGTNNSNIYLESVISEILKKYTGLNVISNHAYKISQDKLKMTTSIYLDLTMVYDLEKVSVVNTIGVAI